jgi:HD-GYP domain-containing protein (c-di-GMP phosphodiesterase class II)
VVSIVAQHHEWFDGSGYPAGLAGENISRNATIVGVADTYDAIISDRPYRNRLATERAIEIVRRQAVTQFDPKIVEVFLQLASNGQLG